MLAYHGGIRKAARKVATAADHTCQALREGRVEQEPAFTDRLLGSIETELDQFRSNGLFWRAKTLTDRGRGAQEAEYGADFMAVFSVDVDGCRYSKGFLAQAKLVPPETRNSESLRLARQCEKMLAMTSAAYVFLYSPDAVSILPALTVLGADGAALWKLHRRSVSRFFEDHFASFIGDRRMSAATPDTLTIMAGEFTARSAILLSVVA